MSASNAALVLAALCSAACALPHASAPVPDDDGGALADIIPGPDRVDPLPDRVDPLPDVVVSLPDVVIECPAGQQRCGDECVDVQTSARHCGRCGAACAAGQSCIAGTCADDCPSPRLMCSGSCVDPSADRAHCGACGRACATGQSCTAGTCVCPSAQSVLCDGSCVDLRADNNHCGACGTRCASGQSCTNSRCACPPNTHACASVTGCQPDDSTMYCGDRCTTCPAPAANGRAVCDAGACRIVCDPMFMPVGNNCERVSTNCGNSVLDAGETCDDGNRAGGDGCSAMCALEANTSTTNCGGTRTPLQITVGQPIQLRGSTSGNGNAFDACNGGRAEGPERVFELQLMQAGSITSRVTPGSSWDLVLRGGSMCPGLCVDRNGDGASEAGTLGPYPAGTRFFLIVDGFRNDESGAFTIETRLDP